MTGMLWLLACAELADRGPRAAPEAVTWRGWIYPSPPVDETAVPLGDATVTFVPEGEDPALVRTRLAHAGFVCVLDRSGDQRLVVGCEPDQREQVRSVIAGTPHATFDGRVLETSRLRFDDDPS